MKIYIFYWYAEPRGGSQDDFELVLKGYYESINRGSRPTMGKKRRARRIDVNHLHATDSPENSKKGGSALLGVCRGKVREYLSCLILYIQFL